MPPGSVSRPQGYYHEIKAVLVEHDPIFASLEAEKKLGWESSDVERLWKLRTEKLSYQHERKIAASSKHVDKNVALSENPFLALAEDDDEEEVEHVEGTVSNNKVMRAAGKGPSYDKYYSFYKDLFESVPEHASVFSINSKKRFLDIGCAPGGLCAYFIRDLGWSGYGFTLQLERGGLKVRFKDPDHLQVQYCDMSEGESVGYISECLTASSSLKFDFVNCGVVMGKHQLESIGEDRETAIQILRVNRNQFLVALRWLVKGGELFWVFQSSNVGCWFYFLSKLQKCFKQPISLFSTLVPSRSPVYALCRDFDPDCDAVREWIEELEQTNNCFDESHLSSWNMTSWDQVSPLLTSLEKDLHKIWTTQRDGLREIREAASSQLQKEELLLKKLSGSVHGTGQGDIGSSGNHHASGSSTPLVKKPFTSSYRADSDFDWRGAPAAASPVVDEDGWQTTSAGGLNKKAGLSKSFKKKPSTSRVSDDLNWRS